jgi:hypothetical protein
MIFAKFLPDKAETDCQRKRASNIKTLELPDDMLTEQEDEEKQQLKQSITLSPAVFQDDSDEMSQSSMLISITIHNNFTHSQLSNVK